MPIAPETSDYTFRNLSRTVACTPARYYRPHNTDELREVVLEAGQAEVRLKVVGAGFSFPALAEVEPAGWMVSLDHMNRVLEVDKPSLRVRVQAGIRLHALSDVLDRHGLALRNVDGCSVQSLGGAIATGTHGTGVAFGNLASQITALHVVTADARLLDLTEADGDLFQAALLHLGALGIVTEATLEVVPAFRLEGGSRSEAFEAALDALPTTLAEHAHVRLTYYPYTGRARLFFADRSTAPIRLPWALLRWVRERLLGHHALRWLHGLGVAFPQHIPRLNHLARVLTGGGGYRVDRSDRVLNMERPPPREELEYAVPAARGAEALRALRRLVEEGGLPVNCAFEARWVKADRQLLSPALDRDVCYVTGAAHGPLAADTFLPAFHEALRAFGARPHLGRRFLFEPGEMLDVLPGARTFDALRRQLDPSGMFENDLLTSLFGPRRDARDADASP